MRLKRERLILDYIEKRNQLLPEKKAGTTVFVHAYPVVGDASISRGRTAIFTPDQEVNLYKSEKDADEAQTRVGGIVIETTADKLKGKIAAASATTIHNQKREDARAASGVRTETYAALVQRTRNQTKWVDAFETESGCQLDW